MSISTNPLKRLASQTAIYGLSSVIGRFLNYLLVPVLTYQFAPAEYGVIAEFYAYMGFLAVVLTLGLETGYFRFRTAGHDDPQRVYATTVRVLLVINSGLFFAIWYWQQPIADLLRHTQRPEYVVWAIAIVALDAIGAAAFARLRADNQALRFAGIKLIEIGINIGLSLFFIVLCQQAFVNQSHSVFAQLWQPDVGIGYVFIVNLVASSVKLLLLAPQFKDGLHGIDYDLLRRMLRYSLPLVMIGLAGIVNEMLDRAALKYLLPFDDQTNLAQLGIYSACYKLSVLMTLFIQAFRYAGEPFFFAYAKASDARQVYALVLNWFMIVCIFLFLLVTLYLNIFQYFIGAAYRDGLSIVPILLAANVLLGLSINLSIWYKLTDHTLLGATVALLGAVITIITLWILIPRYGYQGAAWAHLLCYSVMVIVSYYLGQHFYPVPYDLRRLFGYPIVGLMLYTTHQILTKTWLIIPQWVTSTLLLILFIAMVAWFDGRHLWRLQQR
ncbi:polysaccharide biosynthesis protein [Rhodoferax sp. 4810]|uniref:Polysaccharide biosynthesis protein n=1 Tax=Thiospirillum jenense TaxID=1653858 RepID=A0A839H9N8_9GAMM|nr:polysaccharide biosynthesis C-terminal domain-containing protein [Thiospirillum jenense]MBB1073349.1 polysaccharide biosynthesis protein [Rhodoferax jenense]MBB1125701.1 polysaccharide biosynthesis protein [Thiospirillum jenense]